MIAFNSTKNFLAGLENATEGKRTGDISTASSGGTEKSLLENEMFAIQSRNEEKFLSKQSSVGGGKILKWNKKTFFLLININYTTNLFPFERIEESSSFSFAANSPLSS